MLSTRTTPIRMGNHSGILHRHSSLARATIPTIHPRVKRRAVITNIAFPGEPHADPNFNSSSMDFIKTLMKSFDDIIIRSTKKHMPMTLFAPFITDTLPPDGRTLTPAEEVCDVEIETCKTPIQVWECRCTACGGSGVYKSMWSPRSRGRSHARHYASAYSGTCTVCTGLGFVRHVSADQGVEISCGCAEEYCEVPSFTIGRPQMKPGALKKHQRVQFW